MLTEDIKYQQRIVAFLDVLGFQGKLKEFEEEAIENKANNGLLISLKANEFVGIFKEVIGLMDKFNCNYYLFSDNICITVDPFNDKSLSIEILFTISTLFKRFSELGYFLRGGIDIGLMLDEDDIALGVPLANAYIMESGKAIYPRIIISDKLKKFLDDLRIDDNTAFNKENFLKQSCEVWYINPFYNIIKTDDKLSFFKEYKKCIQKSLKETADKEQVHIKHKWLANEYNDFLSRYTKEINYFEQDETVDADIVKKIKRLKIKQP
jgi:hypothetical protein